MRCLMCGSAGVTERQERTAQGYRRFRCHACGKQFNERALAHEHGEDGEHRTFSEVSTVAHSLPVGVSQRRITKPPARQL
jgi:transposase-like protein